MRLAKKMDWKGLTSGLITFSYEFLRFRSSGTGVSVLLRYNAVLLGNQFLYFKTTQWFRVGKQFLSDPSPLCWIQ
jgi:hypothetical protein